MVRGNFGKFLGMNLVKDVPMVQVTPNGIARDRDPMEKDPTGFSIAEYVPPISWRGNRSGE